MSIDHYQTLGISPSASSAEIKAAYRNLVKQHHPDTGGDQQIILKLNAAWEVLGDQENRLAYDKQAFTSLNQEAQEREIRNARASTAAQNVQGQSAAAKDALSKWLNEVYTPIDRLLGQVINPFSSKLRDLAADPYDDALMQEFCRYLEQSQKKLEKVEQIFQSRPTPIPAQSFGLSLYHCLSQVQDALNELERYTMGYVDSYLHDGHEMLREAKKRRSGLQTERRRFNINS
ncbi:J domain-containing protein [Prochlorococcus sp. MIT 1307]|uniref:J domain-containing protein n=1 Tax=Prochlorococcus sp. MIT 1307 TaxID=3096219 RepID=UPI002A75514B|nr:J domain-containing protein [Prochlorococcus sp. MIT 1307]